MPTFIDESGDPGIKPGSTPHFRLSAVYFEKVDDLRWFQENVAMLRDRLKLPPNFEFHFARISHAHRLAYLKSIADQAFWFVVCSLEKRDFARGSLTKDGIHTMGVDRIVKHLGDKYRAVKLTMPRSERFGERIVHDECFDPTYRKIIQLKFRSLECDDHQRLIKDLRFAKAGAEPGLQLADMVCGAVGQHLQGNSVYYDPIAPQSLAIEVLRP